MRYAIHHVHIKSRDPGSTADWLAGAFGFHAVPDETRVFGDRFIRLRDGAGMLVMVSGPRAGEALAPACTRSQPGLDHVGFRTADLARDLDRLTASGATVAEGPLDMAAGIRAALLVVPGDARVELIEAPAI